MSGYSWLDGRHGLEGLHQGAIGQELRATIACEVGKPLPLGNRAEMRERHVASEAQALATSCTAAGINPQAQATIASKVTGGMTTKAAKESTSGGRGRADQQRSRQSDTPYLLNDLSHTADGSLAKFAPGSAAFVTGGVNTLPKTHAFPEVDPDKVGWVYRYDPQEGWLKLPEERRARHG